MIYPGVVSVTFRQLSPGEIVELAAQAGLRGIEWGGDVHVPHGDVSMAREVRRLTLDAGLTVPAYGSYYRVGHGEPVPFERVIETALALGAPVIRVWAGRRGSADADGAYWRAVVEESRRIADLAYDAGLSVAYEYHGNTLTDTNASALRLLREVEHPSMGTYWQPSGDVDLDAQLRALEAVLPWLVHVHVNQGRRPLAEGSAEWRQRLEVVRSTGRDHYALIEFVEGDEPGALLRDAQTLRAWLDL